MQESAAVISTLLDRLHGGAADYTITVPEAVLERTREIGLRRAMGARQVDIRNQFVREAFAVTVIGGLLGIAMGLAIAKGVAALRRREDDRDVTFQPSRPARGR